MFTWKTLLGTVVLIVFASTAVGEVVIKKTTLEWHDIAKMDGDEVFNSLCAVCHGISGKGDGAAVSALDKGVPDLTVLAANNGGVYSHKDVKKVIFGRFRTIAHGTVDMPPWGEQMMYASRPGWSSFPRRAYSRERINTLTTYIESFQVE
jgi:mono/diheme cytochrome c family protein